MHQAEMLWAKQVKSGKRSSITLCTGEKISVSRADEKLILSYKKSEIKVPVVSPLSHKKFEFVSTDVPNVVMVWYGSSWPEFQTMPCAAGVVLVTESGLQKLPNVSDNAFVYPEAMTQHLVIGEVDRSPFGVSCAAMLHTGSFSEDVAKSYVFPGEEPIIVESVAATAGGGRVHQAENPGFGASCGEVPFLYPWISPDKSRHGWALAMSFVWETVGKERPDENETREVVTENLTIAAVDGHTYHYKAEEDIPESVLDRMVFFDATSDSDEFYEIFLGSKYVHFPFLREICTGERPVYSRYQMELLAFRKFQELLESGKVKSRCCCPRKEPRPATIRLGGWLDPKTGKIHPL